MEVPERTIRSLVAKYNRIDKCMILDSTKPTVLDAHRLLKKDIQKLERLLNK